MGRERRQTQDKPTQLQPMPTIAALSHGGASRNAESKPNNERAICTPISPTTQLPPAQTKHRLADRLLPTMLTLYD